MTDELCMYVVEREEKGPCVTCGFDLDFYGHKRRGRAASGYHPFLGAPKRLCLHAKSEHVDAGVGSLSIFGPFCEACVEDDDNDEIDDAHAYSPSLPCPTCGGEGCNRFSEEMNAIAVGKRGDDVPLRSHIHVPCPNPDCVLGRVRVEVTE